MASSKTELVLRDGQSIIDAETLLQTPLDQLDDETIMLGWSIIDAIEKSLFKDRKAGMRLALIDAAAEHGTKGSKSTVYELGGGVVTVQHKRGKVTYDLAKLRELCDEKDIDFKTLVEVHYKPDAKAIERAVSDGVLKPEDLARFSAVGDQVDALVVEKPAVVKGLLSAG